MPLSTPIISTIVIGLVLAFAFGVVAHRLRLPPLIGYLLAGIAVGPFTPGFVADQTIANELAEIGVILLMFGVGLHFSLEDLLSVRGIAVSGAAAQAFLAIPLALALGWWQGWTPAAGVIFGIALSVASTVVVLRLLQERRLIETERGRITVGWLIVQDLATVLVLVLLPPLAGALKGEAAAQSSVLIQSLALTLAKIAGFVALMLIVGRRVIPALLHYVAHTGSRELFRLSVLSIALGVAYASTVLFGVSLALGAFFAGMVLSESRLSQQAATEALPFRDAFAVLFFVSVGMLFDPSFVFKAPGTLLATVLIIVLGKSIAAYAVVRLFGHRHATALTISGSLAQIGEFSFILAALATRLTLLPESGRDLILAGAIVSILMNPLIFAALDGLLAKSERMRGEAVAAREEEIPTREPIRPTNLTGHVVLIGHGRVGSFISAVLERSATPLFVIEDNDEVVKGLKVRGIEAVSGNAANPEVIRAANLSAARCLLVAIPDAFEGGQVVQQARAIKPFLPIIARAHSEAEIEHLKRHGATMVVMGEHEIAKAMLEEIELPSMSTVAPEPQPKKGSESGRLASERRVTGRE
ncbi:MAG: YbaL family putative K(+) efflux transporter [Methyloceanibacter sp.]